MQESIEKMIRAIKKEGAHIDIPWINIGDPMKLESGVAYDVEKIDLQTSITFVFINGLKYNSTWFTYHIDDKEIRIPGDLCHEDGHDSAVSGTEIIWTYLKQYEYEKSMRAFHGYKIKKYWPGLKKDRRKIRLKRKAREYYAKYCKDKIKIDEYGYCTAEEYACCKYEEYWPYGYR